MKTRQPFVNFLEGLQKVLLHSAPVSVGIAPVGADHLHPWTRNQDVSICSDHFQDFLI